MGSREIIKKDVKIILPTSNPSGENLGIDSLSPETLPWEAESWKDEEPVDDSRVELVQFNNLVGCCKYEKFTVAQMFELAKCQLDKKMGENWSRRNSINGGRFFCTETGVGEAAKLVTFERQDVDGI